MTATVRLADDGRLIVIGTKPIPRLPRLRRYGRLAPLACRAVFHGHAACRTCERLRLRRRSPARLPGCGPAGRCRAAGGMVPPGAYCYDAAKGQEVRTDQPELSQIALRRG
jgi:hypothetical protein